MSLSHVIIGVFMRPMIDDLGWAVWQFTLGSSMSVIAGAISGVMVGQIVDNKGPQFLIRVGALVSASCLCLLGLQSNHFVFLVLYIIGGLSGWNLFGSLVVNATLSKWFVKRRGWALAIGSAGISLAGLITPFTMTVMVDSLGWRIAYGVLAGFTIILVAPIASIMRRTPEDYGMEPDGYTNLSSPAVKMSPIASKTVGFTRAKAIATKGFWLLIIGFSLNQSALTSVLVHAIPFATKAGFSRSAAAIALTINGFGNLASKAFWGYALQRAEPRRLVILAYLLSSLGVGLMLIAATHEEVSILNIGFLLYGFGFGGTIPLSEFLWAKYFGGAHIGAIRAAGYPITTFGTALAPVLVGYWFDVSGTYEPAFLTIIGAYLIGAVIVSASREPL